MPCRATKTRRASSLSMLLPPCGTSRTPVREPPSHVREAHHAGWRTLAARPSDGGRRNGFVSVLLACASEISVVLRVSARSRADVGVIWLILKGFFTTGGSEPPAWEVAHR